MIVIDNNILNKKLVSIFNVMGQKVDVNYSGLKIYLYEDGTIEKVFN